MADESGDELYRALWNRSDNLDLDLVLDKVKAHIDAKKFFNKVVKDTPLHKKLTGSHTNRRLPAFLSYVFHEDADRDDRRGFFKKLDPPTLLALGVLLPRKNIPGIPILEALLVQAPLTIQKACWYKKYDKRIETAALGVGSTSVDYLSFREGKVS